MIRLLKHLDISGKVCTTSSLTLSIRWKIAYNYAKSIVSKEAYDTAINRSLNMPEKTVALLDGMESRIKESPSDFREIVCILKSEPFLSTLADGLVQNYIEKLKMTSSSELIQNVSHPKLT